MFFVTTNLADDAGIVAIFREIGVGATAVFAGLDLVVVFHDYLRSLRVLPKQGRPVALKQKTRKMKGAPAMATRMPPMMCWQVVSSVISIPLFYHGLSYLSSALGGKFSIVISVVYIRTYDRGPQPEMGIPMY
jgi:hypothetical protein